MVESSDKTRSTGEGNGKPLQYSCLENPMNSMKRQKERKSSSLKDELPRSVGAKYATGDQWRNSSRKNEEVEPKQNQHPAVDVTGDGSKVQCCKEQYCIGTWNVRSMNQGKLLSQANSLRLPSVAFRPGPYPKQCSPHLPVQAQLASGGCKRLGCFSAGSYH